MAELSTARSVTVADFARRRAADEKIAIITAYDYSFARIFDASGVDAILVGDSLGTVVQGQPHTIPVTLDQMIYHSQMVVRGTQRALVIGDMPFMSYQLGPRDALVTAGRLVKEAGVAAVKLEGGRAYAPHVRRIVKAGIPVMGHVGLLPQSVHAMGGYRVQGRAEDDADRIVDDAKSLEDAGAFSIVLESVPRELATRITAAVKVPTIGVGAGDGCSGQVLVSYDLLGLTQHSEGKAPKFVRQYAALGEEIKIAVKQYVADVRAGKFPGPENMYFQDKSSEKTASVKH